MPHKHRGRHRWTGGFQNFPETPLLRSLSVPGHSKRQKGRQCLPFAQHVRALQRLPPSPSPSQPEELGPGLSFLRVSSGGKGPAWSRGLRPGGPAGHIPALGIPRGGCPLQWMPARVGPLDRVPAGTGDFWGRALPSASGSGPAAPAPQIKVEPFRCGCPQPPTPRPRTRFCGCRARARARWACVAGSHGPAKGARQRGREGAGQAHALC